MVFSISCFSEWRTLFSVIFLGVCNFSLLQIRAVLLSCCQVGFVGWFFCRVPWLRDVNCDPEKPWCCTRSNVVNRSIVLCWARKEHHNSFASHRVETLQKWRKHGVSSGVRSGRYWLCRPWRSLGNYESVCAGMGSCSQIFLDLQHSAIAHDQDHRAGHAFSIFPPWISTVRALQPRTRPAAPSWPLGWHDSTRVLAIRQGLKHAAPAWNTSWSSRTRCAFIRSWAGCTKSTATRNAGMANCTGYTTTVRLSHGSHQPVTKSHVFHLRGMRARAQTQRCFEPPPPAEVTTHPPKLRSYMPSVSSVSSFWTSSAFGNVAKQMRFSEDFNFDSSSLADVHCTPFRASGNQRFFPKAIWRSRGWRFLCVPLPCLGGQGLRSLGTIWWRRERPSVRTDTVEDCLLKLRTKNVDLLDPSNNMLQGFGTLSHYLNPLDSSTLMGSVPCYLTARLNRSTCSGTPHIAMDVCFEMDITKARFRWMLLTKKRLQWWLSYIDTKSSRQNAA